MNFLLITGPPAVGKMTVGKELAQRLDYKMLHNHDSIELALKFYYFGDKGFTQINEGIRDLVFESTSKNKEINGMIFTLVWAFDVQEDWEYVEKIKQTYLKQGWTFHIVELFADQATRLGRNIKPDRLAAKPSKRNLENSKKSLLEHDEKYKVNSGGEMIKGENYLLIDNTNLSPSATVDQIIKHFSLSPQIDS